MLYADKHIESHENHVNLKLEMAKVWDWLNTNKLTLNARKSNFVIFRPYQRKVDDLINIQIFDNNTQTLRAVVRENRAK